MNITPLYSQYKDDLVKYANKIIHDTFAAEDLVDDVFVRIWQRDPAVLDWRKYLVTAVKLKCLDHLRKAHYRYTKYVDQFPCMHHEETPYDESLAYTALCMVDTLTPCVARDMYLHYIKGLKSARIAAVTNRSSFQSVNNNIYRATQLLKSRL